ncbi:MAG: DUF3299 domain-containing protein [Parvibaculaceae bacterium]
MKTLLPLLLAGLFLPLAMMPAQAEPETLYWEDLMPPEGLKALEEAYAAANPDEVPAQSPVPSDLPEDGSVLPGADPDDPYGTQPPAKQYGTFDVVEELDGKTIRIPGFMVPFDINQMSEVKEFLLVPYFGACIHVPPPPPNQIIYVTSEEAVPFGWEPVWLEGVLETKRHVNDLGSAAYTLNLTKLEPYTEG